MPLVKPKQVKFIRSTNSVDLNVITLLLQLSQFDFTLIDKNNKQFVSIMLNSYLENRFNVIITPPESIINFYLTVRNNLQNEKIEEKARVLMNKIVNLIVKNNER